MCSGRRRTIAISSGASPKPRRRRVLAHRLSAGARASVSGGGGRRRRGLPLAAGAGRRSASDRDHGRFRRRRAHLRDVAAAARRRRAAAGGRRRAVAVDRPRADRRLASASTPGPIRCCIPGRPPTFAKLVSRRRRCQASLRLAALRRSARAAADADPGRHRTKSCSTTPRAWPSGCAPPRSAVRARDLAAHAARLAPVRAHPAGSTSSHRPDRRLRAELARHALTLNRHGARAHRLLCAHFQPLNCAAMTYVEAAAAPLRKTGQIKLHGKDAFEGMRKAGRLVAECLDMLVDEVKPGVADRAARPAGAGVRLRPRRAAGHADVPRLQEIDLHLDQPRGLPRHPGRQAAEGRRHRQHRRHADPQRLARRFQPHVRGGRNPAPRRAADRRDLRGDDARHRRDQAGRHHRRHRRRDPELRRGAST